MVTHPQQSDMPGRVRELERRLSILERADRLSLASISSGGIRVRGGRIVILDDDGNETFVAATDGLSLDGLLEVAGALQVDAAGEARSENFAAGADGFRLRGDGNAEFNSLTLRDGIVEGQWLEDLAVDVAQLANPVQPRQSNAGETGFSITTTVGDKVADTIFVDSFAEITRVAAFSAVSAQNSEASSQLLYCRTRIGGTDGSEMFAGAPPTASAGAISFYTRFITAPGSTVAVSTRSRVSAGTWTAGTIASIGGIAFNSRT